MAVLVLGGGALLWLSLRAAWIFTEAPNFRPQSGVAKGQLEGLGTRASFQHVEMDASA